MIIFELRNFGQICLREKSNSNHQEGIESPKTKWNHCVYSHLTQFISLLHYILKYLLNKAYFEQIFTKLVLKKYIFMNGEEDVLLI